jgi:hypothetical protein
VWAGCRSGSVEWQPNLREYGADEYGRRSCLPYERSSAGCHTGGVILESISDEIR